MMSDQQNGNKTNETTVERPPSGRGGPRTAQGKNRAKYNGTGHGVFAKIVLRGQPYDESKRDLEELLDHLRRAINPADPLQDIQVQQLAFEYFRLTRAYKADAEVAPRAFEKLKNQLDGQEPDVAVIDTIKTAQQVVTRRELDPELIIRYGTSISRNIHRILGELGRLPSEKP